MFEVFEEQLAKYPYAASFFYSFSNQEFIDDKVPNLLHLRESLANISVYDFALIQQECINFFSLSQEIVKRFNHVNSYKELIFRYNDLMKEYAQKQAEYLEKLEIITNAIY